MLCKRKLHSTSCYCVLCIYIFLVFVNTRFIHHVTELYMYTHTCQMLVYWYRKLAAASEELGRMSFALPPDALQPAVPSNEPGSRRGSAARPPPPAAPPTATDPFAAGGLEALLMGPPREVAPSGAPQQPTLAGAVPPAADNPFGGDVPGFAFSGSQGGPFPGGDPFTGPGPLASGAAADPFAMAGLGVVTAGAPPAQGGDPFATLGPLAAGVPNATVGVGNAVGSGGAAGGGAGPAGALGFAGEAVAHAPDNPWAAFDGGAAASAAAQPPASASTGAPGQSGWASAFDAPAAAAPATPAASRPGSAASAGTVAAASPIGFQPLAVEAARGPARAPSAEEERALAEGRALMLRETYRGTCVGERLVRAGGQPL